MIEQPPWTLQDFLPRLDDWVDAEHPLDDLRVLVTDWIFSRMADPFVNARRAPSFSDYWQAVVPRSEHFDDHAERCGVVCLYWVNVIERAVRCDRIVSLSLPIE